MQEPVQDNPRNPGPVATWKERVRAASMAAGLQDQIAVWRDQRARARRGDAEAIENIVDDMGHLVMGDVNVHEHDIQGTNKSNGWIKTLAAALVGTAVGGLGGWELYKAYLASQPQPEPVVQGDRDTDTAYVLEFDESEDN